MTIKPTLKAPFPYFGGKSRVAAEVWRRFGSVTNYVEPFFGSGAALLSRPDWTPGMTETVNDTDGLLCNAWRSIQLSPDETALHADNPVSELDLHARHTWLAGQRESITEKLRADPDWHDPKAGGWWVWGACCWIGKGWCNGKRSSQLPHLGDKGQGINRVTELSRRDYIANLFLNLSLRLQGVRVACGDWTRVTGRSVTYKIANHDTLTAVFLDPPYDSGNHDPYSSSGKGTSASTAEWARSQGDNPLLRIALCGYEGEHDMPGWAEVAWKANGGYGSQGTGRGRENASRERIWFSPHCLSDEAVGLFDSREAV